jgi:hypothetical protein
LGKHKIWCYFWHFWLKGLQIATVGLADGGLDGDADGAEKRSEALALTVAVEHLKRRRPGRTASNARMMASSACPIGCGWAGFCSTVITPLSAMLCWSGGGDRCSPLDFASLRWHTAPMSKLETIKAEVRKPSPEQALQLQNWLANYLEDDAELNPEFVARIQRGQANLREGRVRVRKS